MVSQNALERILWKAVSQLGLNRLYERGRVLATDEGWRVPLSLYSRELKRCVLVAPSDPFMVLVPASHPEAEPDQVEIPLLAVVRKLETMGFDVWRLNQVELLGDIEGVMSRLSRGVSLT